MTVRATLRRKYQVIVALCKAVYFIVWGLYHTLRYGDRYMELGEAMNACDDCDPQNGVWCDEHTEMFEEIIDD